MSIITPSLKELTAEIIRVQRARDLPIEGILVELVCTTFGWQITVGRSPLFGGYRANNYLYADDSEDQIRAEAQCMLWEIDMQLGREDV